MGISCDNMVESAQRVDTETRANNSIIMMILYTMTSDLHQLNLQRNENDIEDVTMYNVDFILMRELVR